MLIPVLLSFHALCWAEEPELPAILVLLSFGFKDDDWFLVKLLVRWIDLQLIYYWI